MRKSGRSVGRGQKEGRCVRRTYRRRRTLGMWDREKREEREEREKREGYEVGNE